MSEGQAAPQRLLSSMNRGAVRKSRGADLEALVGDERLELPTSSV
tara:strand:+ start:469 stop:603 length:135 start_codon:yes stop_codon:yes gene_type:complete